MRERPVSRAVGEATTADRGAAASSPDLAKRIHEGSNRKQQIFNVDKTVLYWKKMLSRTFIARKEKWMLQRTGYLSC